jgi:hypothetical protein
MTLFLLKILLAQPEMDDKFEEGRIVAERVFRGLRQTKPINLSQNLGLNIFILWFNQFMYP